MSRSDNKSNASDGAAKGRDCNEKVFNRAVFEEVKSMKSRFMKLFFPRSIIIITSIYSLDLYFPIYQPGIAPVAKESRTS
jgi:hypothetical protein